MGTHNQWLRFIIGNAADSHIPLHFIYIFIKFRTERRIFNIMDGTVKSFLPINRHPSPPRSQVGMIIRSKKQVKDTVVLRRHSKKSTHNRYLIPFLFLMPYLKLIHCPYIQPKVHCRQLFSISSPLLQVQKAHLQSFALKIRLNLSRFIRESLLLFPTNPYFPPKSVK